MVTSSESGSSEAGSNDGEQAKRGSELASKVLIVEKRRFYIDVKENDRGRFIQIVALLPGSRKSRLYLTMGVARELGALLEKAVINEETEFPNALGKVISPSRTYFADLGENEHGRYLRLTQTCNHAPKRYHIYVPLNGMEEFKTALAEVVSEFGAEDPDEVKLPPSKQLRDVRNKTFYFDCKTNNFGDYLRITETRYSPENRASITVSVKNLPRFHEILGDLLKSFRELRGTDGDAKHESKPESSA